MANQTGLTTAPKKYTTLTKPYWDRYVTGYLTPQINSLNTQINGTFGALQTSYSSYHQGGKVDMTTYYGTMSYKHANGNTVTVDSFANQGWGGSVQKTFTSAEIAAGNAKRQTAINTWNNTTKPALIRQRDALVTQRTAMSAAATMYVEEDVVLKGKNITRVSFLEAFNKHVADRINAKAKWSKNWYEMPIGQADLDSRIWAGIVGTLDYSTFGTFGVMQASADPTVAQLTVAQSPNDPQGATKKSANSVAIKNAIYGLKPAVMQLSRVKNLNVAVYWESGLQRTIQHMAITNRAQIDDAFMYNYMPEGSLITEADAKALFNRLRTDLEARMNTNRDLRVDYCHTSCHSSGRSRR